MLQVSMVESLVEDSPFPFLSLPLEIRYLIYDELLVAKPEMVVRLFYHDRRGRIAGLSLHPQILLANKQVNAKQPRCYMRRMLCRSILRRLRLNHATVACMGMTSGYHKL